MIVAAKRAQVNILLRLSSRWLDRTNTTYRCNSYRPVFISIYLSIGELPYHTSYLLIALQTVPIRIYLKLLHEKLACGIYNMAIQFYNKVTQPVFFKNTLIKGLRRKRVRFAPVSCLFE